MPIGLNNIGWKYYIVNASYNLIQAAIIYLTFIEVRGAHSGGNRRGFEGVIHSDVKIGNVHTFQDTSKSVE